MNVAEQRFIWLLNQRGYAFWTEDQLKQKIKTVTTRPDFFVETPRGNLLVEVKALEKPGPKEERQSKTGTVDIEELLKHLKEPVKETSKQLAPYKSLGIPSMVVLDNWRQIRIPTNIKYLVQIFGTFEFKGRFIPGSGSVVGLMQLYHGKNRRLRKGQHEYISAVAVNIAKVRYLGDDMKTERPMRLTIVHNPFALYPMPKDIFYDKDDEHWHYQNDAWVKI